MKCFSPSLRGYDLTEEENQAYVESLRGYDLIEEENQAYVETCRSRDANQEWLREIYAPLTTSCAADSGCTAEGWSVVQLAILATIGNVDMAMENAMLIPASAFNSPGGTGTP
jgi:hypothetical protein